MGNRNNSEQLLQPTSMTPAAWYASVVGATLWMVITGCFLVASRQWWLAAVPLTGFLFLNCVGVAIWNDRRDRTTIECLKPLFAAYAIVLPIVWFSITLLGSHGVLSQMNWPTRFVIHVAVVFLLPSLIVVLSTVQSDGGLTLRSPFGFESKLARRIELLGVILSMPAVFGLLPGLEWMFAFSAFLSLICVATTVEVLHQKRNQNGESGMVDDSQSSVTDRSFTAR